MAYKAKLKDILRREKDLQEEKQKLLCPIVFRITISVYEIPKTKEGCSRLMERVSKTAEVVNKDKRPWLDLRVVDVSHNHNNVFIFGRKTFIFDNLEKIAKIIALGMATKIGDVGISFSVLNKFHLGDFV